MPRINFGYRQNREDLWAFKGSAKYFYQMAYDTDIEYLIASLSPLIDRMNVYCQPQQYSERNWTMTGRSIGRQLVVLIESLIRKDDYTIIWVANSFISHCNDIGKSRELKQLVIWALKMCIIHITVNEREYIGDGYYRTKGRLFLWRILKNNDLGDQIHKLGFTEQLGQDKYRNSYKLFESSKLGFYNVQRYCRRGFSPRK